MTAEVIAVRGNHIRSLCSVPKAELVYEAPDGSLMAYPIRAASGRASRSSRTWRRAHTASSPAPLRPMRA